MAKSSNPSYCYHNNNMYCVLILCIFLFTTSHVHVECYLPFYLKNNRNHLILSSFNTYEIQSRCHASISNTSSETAASYTTEVTISDADVPFEKPSKEKLSKLEKEFDLMVNDFKAFSNYDIACIENDRYRVLFEGVASGVKEPAVYSSFVVLYEDYVPVRIAGRMIYRHLKDIMAKSVKAIATETNVIKIRTGLTTEDIDDGRLAFLAVKHDNTFVEKDELTMEQLVNSGIVDTVIEILGYDSFEAFISDMDHDQSGALTFETFMVGLQNCAQNSGENSCKVSSVLEDLNNRIGPLNTRRKLVPLDQRKKKYSDRYDNMITFFKEWERLLLPSNTNKKKLSRTEIILQGCIVGALNESIVNALRVLYLDYSALRIAGDLIFKLVSVLVNKKKRKMSNNLV